MIGTIGKLGTVSKIAIAQGSRARVPIYVYSPRELFAANEPGAWYDPSDLTTLFQDSAGTTPVTAAGQVVGLVLDKSMGLVLGAELAANGNFNGSTGWTLGSGHTISNNQLNIAAAVTTTSSGSTVGGLFTPGRTYRITYKVSNYTKGSVRVVVGASGGVIRTSNGTFTEYLLATTTSGVITVQNIGDTSLTIDIISARELPGNHATQATAASRPILAREPVGGRRNLLTYTEEFQNAAWNKTNITVGADAIAAPNGSITADKIEATASAVTVIARTVSVAATSATASIYVKKGSAAGDANKFGIRNSTTANNLLQFTFNYDTGAISYTTGSSGAIATDVGNGWWRLTFTVSSGITSGDSLTFWFGFWGSSETAGEFAYTWGAQLETGSTATAYQCVTSSSDVTEAGKPNLWYLLFDGTDDFLVTPTITPGTDKVQVFAGVRKLSDAVAGIVVETSPSATANNGGLYIVAPNSNAPTYGFASRGTSLGSAVSAGFSSPITNVLTGIGDIAADVSILRVNGAQVASAATNQGTGNYLAYPLYIGRRGGTMLPFNGRIYQMLVRFGANLSADQISQTETWVNSKTGAY